MFDGIKNFVSRWRAVRQMEKKGQLGTRKRRTGNTLASAAENSRVMNVFVLLLLWVSCSLLLVLSAHRKIDFSWGEYEHAPRTVFAAFDFEYEDVAATRELQEAAAAREPVVLKVRESALEQLNQRFQDFFVRVAAREDDDALLAGVDLSSGRQALEACRKLIHDPTAFQEFTANVSLLLNSGLVAEATRSAFAPETPVRVEDPRGRRRLRTMETLRTPAEAGRELAAHILKAVPGESEGIPAVETALSGVLAGLFGRDGDLFVDDTETMELQKQAVTNVKPILKRVERNAVIVAGDAFLSENDRNSLAQYQTLYNSQVRVVDFNLELLGDLAFCLFLVLFSALYLWHMHPDVINSNRQLFLLSSIVLISLVINSVYIQIFQLASAEYGISPRLIFSVVPVLLASVLLAVVMGLRVAMSGGFFVAVITAQMLRMPFQQAVLALVICAVAGLAVRRSANYRSLFLRTFGLLTLYWFLDGDIVKILIDHPDEILRTVIVAGVSIVSGAMLVLPLIFIFELVFNVSTNMSLLVLCDFNHPLLKELHLRAPGTSMHSQNVAILAENAAKCIDANPLKARAAALYHDIGKIVNPEYFTENNIDTANQHTALSPRMSSMIIMNHVKDGLDMALKYKLCRVVRDAIRQHHGTDLLHFYRLARTSQNEGPPVEKDYRYPGPLPHDREIVIVSLADACEAYCRSLEKPTASKIEAVVDEIFRNRMRDGQLDDAQLTVAELAKIKESFIWTLTTMYHSRIAYKKSENDDEGDLFLEKPAPPASAAGRADSRGATGN